MAAVLALLAVGPAPLAATPAAARPAAAVTTATDLTDTGTPVVAELADGDTVLLARRWGDVLHRRVHHLADDSWGDWESTLGTAASDPAVARELNTRLSVVARRDDGHLWWQRQSTGGWSDWTDLGAPTGTTAVGSPVLVTDDNTLTNRAADSSGAVRGNTDGRLELFVRGANGQLWHRMQKSPNGSAWSGWESLPGFWSGGFTAVTGADGRITVAARKDDGRVRVITQQSPSKPDSPLPADNWPSWTEIGTGFTGGLALASNINDKGTALLQVFGNKSNGTLWTVAQTTPRSAQNPAGEWDTGLNLGPAVAARPAVATHSDGRLAVYGTDPQGHVTYRTQTSAATRNSPDGIWEGNWRALGDRAVRSLALRPASGTGNDGFGVFALDRDSYTLYQRTRLALGSADGNRPDLWADWNNLSAAGDNPCEGPGSLGCLNITADFGPFLGLEDKADSGSRAGVGLPDISGPEEWSLRPLAGDPGGQVTIVDRRWSGCLQPDAAGSIATHLRIAPCDARMPQGWYLDPVPTAGTDPATRGLAGYRIRSGGSGTCLTALVANRFRHTAALPEMISCDTTDDNDHTVWKLEHNGVPTPGVLNTALDQAARRCANDPGRTGSNCVFVPVQQESSAYRAAGGCVVGKVVYNQSSAVNSYSLSWTRTTGTELSVGGSVGGRLSMLSAQFTASATWVQQDSVTDQLTINVPEGQFGWIESRPVRRETVGYWEFTATGRAAWTVPGRNLSYAKDGTDGATVVNVFRSSPTPPTSRSCG
ncbi:hypothetical protein [Kitasatospora sp. NPDC088134]|uniref:hypothetical protein n=1 Tax=Kitasatospora sp. NPDC088134 TaxID=3364071 RepID=UPI00381ADAA6